MAGLPVGHHSVLGHGLGLNETWAPRIVSEANALQDSLEETSWISHCRRDTRLDDLVDWSQCYDMVLKLELNLNLILDIKFNFEQCILFSG